MSSTSIWMFGTSAESGNSKNLVDRVSSLNDRACDDAVVVSVMGADKASVGRRGVSWGGA